MARTGCRSWTPRPQKNSRRPEAELSARVADGSLLCRAGETEQKPSPGSRRPLCQPCPTNLVQASSREYDVAGAFSYAKSSVLSDLQPDRAGPVVRISKSRRARCQIFSSETIR